MHFSFAPVAFWTAVLTACTAELACVSRAVGLVLRWGAPQSVCLGTLVGTALTLLPLWLWGGQLRHCLPEAPLRFGAALFFIGMGVSMLFGHAH